jgi:hypothetical protein
VLTGGGQSLLARGSEVSALTHKAQPLEHNLPEVERQVACTGMNRRHARSKKTKSLLHDYLPWAKTNSIVMFFTASQPILVLWV